MEKVYFITVAILFIFVVLLQQKNSTLGSMMGGGAGDEVAQTRRGADKFLHRATIVLTIMLFGGGLFVMFT